MTFSIKTRKGKKGIKKRMKNLFNEQKTVTNIVINNPTMSVTA